MPNGDDKKSMWRDVSDQDLSTTPNQASSGPATGIGPDTRGNWQRLKDYVAAKWREPAGLGSLDEPYRPGIGYGPTTGEVVSGVGQEALTFSAPAVLESAPAIAAATRLPQRVKSAAGGATEGYAVGSGLEKMGIPYAARAGAIGGGLYGAITGRDPGMTLIERVGRAWRGTPGVATPPTISGEVGAAQPRGSLVVTPQQQAEDVGRFYAGGGPGGGTPAGPNPYVTEQNQQLLQKLRRR
jgi:hypothetical protein